MMLIQVWSKMPNPLLKQLLKPYFQATRKIRKKSCNLLDKIMNIQNKGECEMNKKIKKLRKEIWKLMRVKIPTIFESSVDEEEELEANLEVELSIGKYAGATTWELGNDDESLLITVYPSGLVNICVDEVSHCEKQFTLCDDLSDKSTDAKQIVTDIATLLDIFLESNWHAFMDYVVKYKDDWRKAVMEYYNSNTVFF